MQQLCLTYPLRWRAPLSPSPSFFPCRSHRDSSCSMPSEGPLVNASSTFRPRLIVDVKQSCFAALVLPVAAACTVMMGSPASVEAGILSGSSGLESFQLPALPAPDLLKKIQEANVEKYKAFDSNFKKSPFLQELLKKSKENKALHDKEIQDKYCERGAEWGVGDCSLTGLPQADKDAFFETLRKGRSESAK